MKHEKIEAAAQLEIIKQLRELNRRAKTATDHRDFFRHVNGPWHADAYRQDFQRLDSLLRAIYTDSVIAWTYGEAVSKITFENRGEVALKELIDSVVNYQKGKR